MRDFAKPVSTRARSEFINRQIFRAACAGAVVGGVTVAMVYTVVAVSIVLS